MMLLWDVLGVVVDTHPYCCVGKGWKDMKTLLEPKDETYIRLKLVRSVAKLAQPIQYNLSQMLGVLYIILALHCN